MLKGSPVQILSQFSTLKHDCKKISIKKKKIKLLGEKMSTCIMKDFYLLPHCLFWNVLQVDSYGR